MGRNLNLDRGTVLRGQASEQFTDEVVYCTPTADGSGSGTIPAHAKTVKLAAVSSAAHILVLPPPVVGKRLCVINTTGTGFELRSSAPATIGINGGTGASAQSALASTALQIDLVCISATQWLANSRVAAGTYSAVEAAA